MATPSDNLPDLEAFIASRQWKFSFPPDLEAVYRDQTRSYRRALMRRLALPSALIYNAFLLADHLLVPDTFLTAAILHLAVITPFIFLASFLYGLDIKPPLRDLAAALVPVLFVGQIMLIYALNDTAGADHYQYLAIFIVVFMNVNMRLGYRFAVATTVALAAIYLAVLLPGPASMAAKLVGGSGMVAVCYLTLQGSLRMEREMRHSFLMRLRETLRRESAEEDANRDPLTGIANRRRLDEVAGRVWREPATRAAPVALLMIDIDWFKLFNDRYGHPSGDTCLKRVAGVISAELRHEDDIAVRLGGEEFLVMLTRTDRDMAIRIAERIRRSIEGLAIPHHDGCAGRVVTASFGVSAGRPAEHSVEALLRAADEALYEAKQRGRNRVSPPLLETAADNGIRAASKTGLGAA